MLTRSCDINYTYSYKHYENIIIREEIIHFTDAILERTSRSFERDVIGLSSFSLEVKETRSKTQLDCFYLTVSRVSRKSCTLISKPNGHLAQRGVRFSIAKKKKNLTASGVN